MRVVIGVLSSFELLLGEKELSRTAIGLIEGLRELGLEQGEDYSVITSHSDSQEKQSTTVAEWVKSRAVDLVVAGGSILADAASEGFGRAKASLPLVYFGVHPVDGDLIVGKERLEKPDTVCVEIPLPLVWTHRNFRVLKQMFPDLENVFSPYACNTLFCHPNMRERYDAHRISDGPHSWLSGNDVGYQIVKDWCWLIDANYYEYPLCKSNEFAVALESIPSRKTSQPAKNVIIAFNDSFQVDGAVQTLITHANRSNTPLVWVNNPQIVEEGVVADFSTRFEPAAGLAARFVSEFVRGEWTEGRYEHVMCDDNWFTLNINRMAQLGLEHSGVTALKTHFHSVLGAQTNAKEEDNG